VEPKAKTERRHALRRFRERFGFSVHDHEYVEIVRKIQNNEAKYLARQSNRVTLWQQNVRGEEVVLFYDKMRKEIVTVLNISQTQWGRKETQ
jgi:hypothetical protein